MYIKQCLFKGSPNCKLTHCRNCCWNCFSVGTRLYWTDPSELAFSDSKWEKGGRKGGNKWEKEGRKGGNKGKKRQYLDKLIKQIFRHPPLFLNITYYWKFLSSHTHTHTHTNTSPSRNVEKLVASIPAKESCLLCLSISPREMPYPEVIKAAELVMPSQQIHAGLHWQMRSLQIRLSGLS